MGGLIRPYPLYRSIWQALDWVFPPACAGCGKPGGRWCATCRGQLQIIQGKTCPKCGRPESGGNLCARCLAEPPCYEALRSWALFEGPVRNALHRLKYRRDIALGDWLAAEVSSSLRAQAWPIQIVTPVPLARAREKERGYNQAGLIARPLALALGLKYAPRALTRWRDTRSQVGLTGEQRRENVRGVFRAEGAQVEGRTVLLIDDVTTTGSTLSSAAEALLVGGASKVYAFTIARA